MVTFKVQADRIQSNDEAASVWVAVKISAEDTAPPAVPTQADVDALLPWKWKTLAGGSAWNPHSRDAWSLWLIDPADPTRPTLVNKLRVCEVSHYPLIHPITPRLDAAVAAISGSEGAIRRESLGMPPQAEPTCLAGTVPGFVERLASVPHPVPSASAVHALLAIDGLARAGELDDMLIIAAPRVTPRVGQPFDAEPLCPVFVEDPDNKANVHWTLASAPHAAELKSTRVVSKMRADPGSGRILDLFDQTIALTTDPLKTLPTADALANLPQALADAIDPLARLQSVLADGLREWIARTPGGDELLRKDFGLTVDPGVAPAFALKRMLDTIAVQVLAARYDAVGRFEVPLVEALDNRDDDTAIALLAKHLASTPTGIDGSRITAAWRVDPTSVFPANRNADAAARIADASPFTLDQLCHLAGFEVETPSRQIKTDIDVLRLLWSQPAAVPVPAPGEKSGLRYFKLPLEQTGAPGEPLRLVQTFRPGPSAQPGGGAVVEVFTDISFDRARASAALGFAAPFIEGLVSGRADWSRAGSGELAAPLFKRFGTSLDALLKGNAQIQGLYTTMAESAARVTQVETQDAMFGLLLSLLDAAADEAIAMGTALAPRVHPFDTFTQLPLPLSFQIDQMQTFSRHVDDWARLSGYGLMVRRAGTVNETPYVSLNAASLFFGLKNAVARDPGYLAEVADLYSNREAVLGVKADDTSRSFVDPNPFSPGDQVGVSDAIAEYSNAWQTAPMPGQAALGQDGGPQGVEACRFLYGPPGAPAPKLPTLSFGRDYAVLAHLVAQGGVLAPFARAPNNPYVLAADIDDQLVPTSPIHYLRTVPVSGPSFEADAPPPPPAVSLLAEELPKRQPSRRLNGSGVRMNHEPRLGVPRAACGPGPNGGLRFEFVIDSSGPARIDLSIDAIEGSHPLVIDLACAVSGQWYRLDILRSRQLVLSTRWIGPGAEDELRPDPTWSEVSRSNLGYVPTAVSLRLSSAMPVVAEPLRVVKIVTDGNAASELGDAEGQGASRATTLLLDGLEPPEPTAAQLISNGLVRTMATIEIKGPNVDRHTWERWVNCALFATGARPDLRKRVADELNRLQREDAVTRSDLPDPAVSGLWLELWQVFPQRARVGAPLQFDAKPHDDPLAQPRVKVEIELDSAALPTGGDFAKSNDKATATCQAGHVYELRAQAVIKCKDTPFDGLTANDVRFGSAVLESFTPMTADVDLLLGPTSVLPIEVATAEMPIVEDPTWNPNEVVPLRWDGERRLVDLKFPRRFFQGVDGGRRALRYCSTASLVPQHWTWRGRPDPQGETQLFDRAFAGRRDDDHGSLKTGTISVGHALGVDPKSSAEAPSITSRDLDWRGGWNLWRFGIRLSSRYEALFHARARSRAVTTLSRSYPSTRWLDRSVPDAVNTREVSPPPLVLILPLTEADTIDGMVPPLLALVVEQMHANGNFGDGVVVAMDVARHPYPAFQRDATATGLKPVEALKYLPEVGRDPIRSGKAYDGSAIALRLDGPIGYGFDLGSEAGRFTHSGFLISPVKHALPPWSMIKLKLRRLELSGRPAPTTLRTDPLAVRGRWTDDRNFAADDVRDATPFDGLIIHPDYTLDTEFDIAFYDEKNAKDGPSGQRVALEVSKIGDRWSVGASVLKVDPNKVNDWRSIDGWPNAGRFDFTRGAHQPTIRLIVSASTKPERDADWIPSGEVMVQVSLGDGEVEQGGNGWMTIFNLPIEAAHREPTSNDPRIAVGVPSRVQPVRLSDFSPSMWCQFTVASSKVLLEVTAISTEVAEVDTLDLKAPKKGRDPSWSGLVLHKDGQTRRMAPDDLPPASEEKSELIEMRVALFTEDAFDISRHICERPVVAVTLEDKIFNERTVTGAGKVLWEDEKNSKPGKTGRWRLMRILRHKNDEITSLADLFAEPFDAPLQEPKDALGMILTVSRPFPKRPE